MKRFFVFLLATLLIFPFSACSKKEDLNTISNNLTTYEISLNLDCENKQVEAKQTVNYVNNTNSILKTIKFHLYPQFFEEGATKFIVASNQMNDAFPNGLSFANFDVKKVEVDQIVKPVVYENEFDDILSVELNSSLVPNSKTTIYLEYSFTLPNCNHRFGYGSNTINLANFYPIVCVYENGEFNTSGYHSNGDPFYSDMANYCVSLNADNKYVVASTGIKKEEKVENEIKTTKFSANIVRDFALVLSQEFKILNKTQGQTKIEYYYIHDKNPEQSIQTGADSIKTFSKLFGNYPYENFSIVENDFIYGGMEYPNLVMISNSIENKDDFLNVIIHETAHQWWYAMVGNDEFKYPWLDEALTEFSTILFYDYNDGYNLTHEKMIDASRENYSLFISVYEDVLGPINTSMRSVDEYSTEPEYTYCTYVKGVLMYESLYNLIGEKKFINGLKTYFENNKFKNANPEALISALNKTCGQDLSNFFASWINGKVVIR